MKSFLLFAALLGAVALSALAPSATNAANTGGKERAVMTFNSPVILMGVILKGEYLFVHDDDAMARGEACTFVYEGQAAIAKKLVVSFHCTPAERAKADHFTTRSVTTAKGQELREYQFEGRTEAHLVPMDHGHVDILNP